MTDKIPQLASKQLEPLLTPLSEIKPHPDNYKKHPTEQLKALKASLKAFGCTQPIKVNLEGYIVAGHGMYQVYIEEGYTHAPVLYEALDSKLSKAYIVADNETSRKAQTDQEQLNKLLDEALEIPDFDITAIGFDLEDIEQCSNITGPQEVVEDEFNPDDIKESRCKEGELWQLGRHRLLCGSSINSKDVKILMGGEDAELLFTSPPYSDMRDYNGGKDLSVDNLCNFIKCYHGYANYQVINIGLQFKDSEVVQYWDSYLEAGKEAGYKFLAWNVWDKTQAGSIAQATNMFFLTHEWIFVFGESKKRLNRTIENQLDKYEKRHGKDFLKGINKSVRQKDGTMGNTSSATYTHHQLHSVLQQTPELSDLRKLHPAMFPIGLPAAYIEAMTNVNDNVIEPFCGSGTTLITCEQLNRTCYAMELDPHYCDVIISRWEQFTGQTAVKL